MTSLRLSRSVSVWGSGLALAAGFALPGAASAATASPGNVTVSAASKAPAAAALRTAKVTVTGVRPASVKRGRWTLPVSGSPSLDAKSVALNGRLRFARGKRNVTFTSLRLSLGKKPALSGTVGKRRITVLTLAGAPKRDAAAGTISLKGARTSLGSAAVRTLRKDLKASRIKTGRLGSTTMSVRVKVAVPGPVTPAPAPVPAPQPTVPTPGLPIDPGGLPPELPQPEPVCWADTPAGATDWIGCGTQTGGRLKTWIDYLGTGGTVDVSTGATRLSTYNARLSPGTWQDAPEGRVINAHAGRFHYRYPAHGNLDVRVENLTFDVAADRKSANVYVDAAYNSFSDPEPVVSNGMLAMTVDLTAARSRVSADGATTFEVAPAFLTQGGVTIWSNFYDVGVRFGAFTITVPNAAG